MILSADESNCGFQRNKGGFVRGDRDEKER